MKKNGSLAILTLLAIIATGSATLYCSQPEKTAPPTTTATSNETPIDGAYLVVLGGCNDCHTPKIMTPNGPALDTTRILAGYPEGAALPPTTYDASKPGSYVLLDPSLTAAVGPWGTSFAANLTPDSATGLGSWTFENFKNAMQKGKHLGLDGERPILPPMPWQNLAMWKETDLQSLFAYLKSIPAVKNKVPAPLPPTAAK